MAIEIERKFKVTGDGWRASATRRTLLRQGYLANTERCSVRIRVAEEGGWLSVKAMTAGVARAEYEVPVDLKDALELLQLREGAIVEKYRHIVPHGRHQWEIDQFLGENQGLVIAEIELQSEDEPFERPAWLGEEVTHAARYYNLRLAMQPYQRWPQSESG